MIIEEQKSSKKGTIEIEILSWIKAIVFAGIVAFSINNFVLVNATVPTASMEPTIATNDRIVAQKI